MYSRVKQVLPNISVVAFSLIIFCHLFAVPTSVAEIGDISPDNIWQEISERDIQAVRLGGDMTWPVKTRYFEVHQTVLTNLLDTAPMDDAVGLLSGAILTLPSPSGTFSRYQVFETSFLGPDLKEQYPDIRTYAGQSIDDPSASVRIDLTLFGFRAMITSASGSFFVDPYSRSTTQYYVCYWKRDLPNNSMLFNCFFDDPASNFISTKAIPTSGDQLFVYRLAVTATGEYTEHYGGVPQAQAQITTTMNRVTGIYEREACVRFTLVATNIYSDHDSDPFPNGGSVNSDLLAQNQTDLDANVGSNNYDIGHILSQGGSGGLASLGVVCVDGSKGRGATSQANPSGDAFDVDYVAHEIGHQMGANHTFNDGHSGSCAGGNRNAGTAYEPGSGSTIMGYAGICSPHNVQANSDDYFHVSSLEEIISHRNSIGSCATTSATNNAIPVADAGSDYTIPRDTPFTLVGTGHDSDGPTVTYCWEQFDLGNASPPTDFLNGPLFRSYQPHITDSQFNCVRTFPPIDNILSGITSSWDLLPTSDRSMTFRLTVRDHHFNGGGVDDDEMTITVSGSPFRITFPNGGEYLGSNGPATVTWDIGGGSVASHVRISISIDGGISFMPLINTTENDGSCDVTLPDNITNQARLKIESVDNIFFDLSDGNFSLSEVGACIAYILDRSGSMSGSPLANAKAAANQGITTMHERDEVAVVSFSSGASVNFSRTPITNDSVRASARSAVNSLSAGGTTSIGAGLLAGYNQLLTSRSTDRDYVLLSDGMENTAPWAADILPLFLNLTRDEIDHRIHAIAYGSGADQALMSELAGVTGGVFLFSPGTNDPLALADLFFTIQTSIFDEQRLASHGGTITAPNSHSYAYTVSGDMASNTVSLLWNSTGNQLSLELQKPDGTWINSANWTSHQGVTRVSGPGIDYFTMNNPIDGDWNARIVANSGTVSYALVVTAQTTVRMDVDFDHDAYPTGTPIIVTAALTEGNLPIFGANVTATVETPTAAMAALNASYERGSERDGAFDLFRSDDGRDLIGADDIVYFTSVDLPMMDDGAHGDGGPNDGVYGAIYTDTQVSGSYRFRVVASGTTSSGIEFTRESSRSTVVDPNQVLTFDLVVQSENPTTGVPIAITPPDHYGQGNGTTEFARIYAAPAAVTLTAPSTAPGGSAFRHWLVDGVVTTNDMSLQVTMDGHHDVKAVYGGCTWSAWQDLADQSVSYCTAWGDYDNDGDPDLLMAGAGRNLLYENIAGVMTEVSGWSNDADPSFGAVWGDYDNDGDLDLYVVNSLTANALYRNNGGTFERVAAGDAADTGDGYNAAWADIDNDGDLDLYVCNRNGTSRLLLNEAGNFVRAGGVTEVDGTSRGCAFADYDNDGDQDLYVSMSTANFLFRNDGGDYVDVSAPPINDRGQGKGVAWADYDNDGDLDLYLVNTNGSNKLFRNDLPGYFTDVTDALLGDANNGRACAWSDYDNNGWLDLFLTNHSGGNHLYQNMYGVFADSTCGALDATATLPSWGCSFADYDLDGDQDLAVAFVSPADASKLFRNGLESGPTRNWLQVDLRGVMSNKFGIGAKILIDNGEISQMREVSASGNYLGQSPTTVSFGTADAERIDMTVLWPSGVVQQLLQVSTNQRLTVTEQSGNTPVEELPVPSRLEIANYPNPFNPSTTIEFALPEEAEVELLILDVRGRRVNTLTRGVAYPAGRHYVVWHGRDDDGQSVPSGLYFYRCVAGGESVTGSMLLLK